MTGWWLAARRACAKNWDWGNFLLKERASSKWRRLRPRFGKFYYPGLEKLRNYEPQQARSYLQRAVDIEQAFPLAHAALAEALSELGYDKKSNGGSQASGDAFQGPCRSKINNPSKAGTMRWPPNGDQAIGAYEKLYHYKRDNLEYGLQLAKDPVVGRQGIGPRLPLWPSCENFPNPRATTRAIDSG